MAHFSLTRRGLALMGTTLLMLGACGEPEVILPGERENIRGTDETATLGLPSEAKPIRLAAPTSNKSWPQSFGTESFRVAHPALRTAPQLVWSADIGEGNSRRQRITASPVIAGGLIYTLDSAARVSATSSSGGAVWSTDLVPAGEKEGQATGGGMAYSDGVLYVSSGYGLLTALDAKSGTLRWQQKLNATGSGTPTVRDGLIYLVAGDDTGWAIRTKDGRIAWQIQGTPSVGNVLGAPAPALTSDLAIFAFGSGDISASFKKGGLGRWTSSVSGQRKGRAAALIGDVTGSPVVSGKRVYVGNHSGRTVALDSVSGQRFWTADEGALGPIWPAGDSIFLVSDRNQLVRMNASDGTIVWAKELPGFVKDKPGKRGASYANYGPILAGGRVIVASGDGNIRFFKPEDGAMTAQVPIPNGASSGPVVAGNTLYVVGAKGQLYAFR